MDSNNQNNINNFNQKPEDRGMLDLMKDAYNNRVKQPVLDFVEKNKK